MPPLATMVYDTKISQYSSSHQCESQINAVPTKKASTVESTNDADEMTKSSEISRKKVTFKSSVKIRRITSHRKYSTEERANVWYSPEENKAIRKRAVMTVKKHMKGIDIDSSEEDCFRGLEFKTPEKNKIRQQRKIDIIWEVLLEQESLQLEGVVDPQRLADTYATFTGQAINEARRRGKKDEIAVYSAKD